MMTFVKKIVSTATMLALLLASTAILHADAETGTKTIEYYKYDLQLEGDDVRFDTYSLTVSEANYNTRSAIPGVTSPDTRVPDTNSSVVRVGMYHSDPYGSSGYVSATGFIVDAHTIATAAHLVYKPNAAGVAYGVEYGDVFVDDEDYANPIRHKITEVHIPKEYTTNPSHDCDYALVTVDADLSEYGIFKLGCISGEAGLVDQIKLSVSGFPANLLGEDDEIITNPYYQLYTGRGTLIQTWPERIFYSNDASGGNSGGPVYVTTRYTMNGTDWTEYNTVVGICTGRDYMTEGSDAMYNDAKRITEPVLQFYLNNPNIGY